MTINYSIIFKISGTLSLILGASMVPPLVVSYFNDSSFVALSFLVLSIPLIILGILINYLTRNVSKNIKVRDGFFIVSYCWIIASLVGALPYYISGTVPSLTDSIFEAAAAFTTTSCSVIHGVTLPMGIILWNAIMRWIGALSIIIFAISILPALGVNSLKLVNPEAYNPNLNKAKPKILDSVRTLYLIYIGLTLSEFFLLAVSDMGIFEAVINTLGSVSTSGTANGIADLASYGSIYIESIITIFTFLASINFVLFYFLVKGELKNIFQDAELKTFMLIISVSFILVSITFYVTGTYPTLTESIGKAIFQTVSFSTTSGYFVADGTLWPSLAQAIFFTLMCIGGCAASTCGSFKVIRLYILIKLILRGFRKRLHPRSVVAVRLGKSVISAETVSSVTSFAMLYLIIYFLTTLVLSLDNVDMITTLTATAGILTNTGLAFGELGPTNDFSLFSSPMRLFISFMMIVGRLELFTVLILFTPSFWNGEK